MLGIVLDDQDRVRLRRAGASRWSLTMVGRASAHARDGSAPSTGTRGVRQRPVKRSTPRPGSLSSSTAPAVRPHDVLHDRRARGPNLPARARADRRRDRTSGRFACARRARCRCPLSATEMPHRVVGGRRAHRDLARARRRICRRSRAGSPPRRPARRGRRDSAGMSGGTSPRARLRAARAPARRTGWPPR